MTFYPKSKAFDYMIDKQVKKLVSGVKVIFPGVKCLKLLIMEVIVTIVNTCLKNWKMSKKITGIAIKVIPVTV